MRLKRYGCARRPSQAVGALFLTCGVLLAAESITVDRVQQRYPWNGLVDIDYTIAGVEGDPNDYQIEFTMTVDGKSFVASNFWDAAWCDHATANGRQRATWNARADGIAALAEVGVAAKLVYAPCTDADATFAIIDLSAGPRSTAYPVRYVNADTNRTAQFNIPAYKLSKLVLKKVSAGEFWMGGHVSSNPPEAGSVESGTNRHRVRLTRDYFLGLFEVTQKQYDQVASATTNGFNRYVSGYVGRYAVGEDQAMMPANNVWYDKIMSETESWGGANSSVQYHAFMRKLNERTTCRGQSVGLFCLPTEAQWEYACRAGTETTYYWGNATNEIERYAWANFESLSASPKTYCHEVGLLLPNAWGFYDMAGNVEEWCSDLYGAYPAYSETEVTEDPTGAEASTDRPVRGGSYWRPRANCASGLRAPSDTTGSGRNGYGNWTGNSWGFRLCENLK